ncbi:tetratricopeptide repeat protein [Aneurinibacillus sp. Ricciae_BoGa-3]|uniref:tetratricopeptide repeat protein n=1 Tax=Aneurinibacillus sp. Ricciae_BoGa-3 TaxID=3022697 RepID=UPI002340B418|nr:tetratricopeptide repeat protein [Aneurinibacillus sp. Ricciae_BoGa-3]WCK56112.1 tetratricopeptide repeat protein [Aneurinibacillus sp. Ricciae_BoGa-3]
MLSDYFSTLSGQIDRINEKWSGLTTEQKEKYFSRILELRELSDSFVEEWLTFEEKLINIQRVAEQDLTIDAPSALQPITAEQHEYHADDSEVYVTLPMASAFRKGQGYFDLSMYEESARSFGQLIEQMPDLSIARLFLAFSFFISNDLERAHRHFRMLAETSEEPLILAAACNALGCISVLEERGDQGIVWFDRAIQYEPQFQDAIFNKALTLFYAREWIECLTVLENFKEEDNDFEIQLLRFCALLHNGERRKALFHLQKAEQLTHKKSSVNDRRAIAQGYEQLGLFQRAAEAYRNLLPAARKEAWIWHALGWSLWQHNKSEEALLHLKRALSLAPDSAEYACSYAWILLRTGHANEAYRIFSHVACRCMESGNPLPLTQAVACAGKIEALMQLQPGDADSMREAQATAERLLNNPLPPIQALGHYECGKLALLIGNKKRAWEHFRSSDSLIREAEMYAGFLHYLDGEYTQAYTKWKGKQPVQ